MTDEKPVVVPAIKPTVKSKLVPQSNGNFACLIDGKVFGFISAHPIGGLVLEDDPRNPTYLSVGTHEVTFGGKKYKVTVKALEKFFMNEDRGQIIADLQTKRNAGDTKIDMNEYSIDKALKAASDNNKEAREELLSRVVVEAI